MTTTYLQPAARTSQRFAWTGPNTSPLKDAAGFQSPAALAANPERGAVKQFLTALLRSLAAWQA
jgi:hypothetical protein